MNLVNVNNINYFNKIIAKKRWKNAFRDKKFTAFLVVSLILFALQMLCLFKFQVQIENRKGFAFVDPIFGNFPIFNLNLLTFVAIYSAQIFAIFLACFKPEKFLQILLGYFFVYFFRIFSMYLLPLEPPIGLVPLEDPLLIWFGNGAIINKDLFYSGHTSTTFMVFLVTENIKAKIYIFIALLVVIFGILSQRVHYSIDVYAAFFFTFTAYRLGIFIINKLGFTNYSENMQIK